MEEDNAGRPSTSKHASANARPLFSPFRALGLVSEGGTPFAMQRRGRETFVVTSVGTSWQVRLVNLDFGRVLHDLTSSRFGRDLTVC